MMNVIELDDDNDAHFLSLIEAAEAEALASATAGRNKRRTISSVATASDQETTVEIEGSYAAALRGSRSSLWQQKQQQQQLARPQKKAKDNSSYLAASSVGGGDACFKCGVSGHWARDCTSAGGGDGLGRGGPAVGGVVDEKPCPCGSGSCSVMTSNTPKNPGRKFYRCPLREENGGCNFFEWCDNPSSGLPASGRASTEVKSSNGASKWSNEPSSIWRQTSFSSQAQSNSGIHSSSQYAGERNSSSCFKCGQEGHWARDCTKSASDHGGGGPLSSSSSGSCFKCGKAGHWARDCTVQDSVSSSLEKKASRSFRNPSVNKY